MFINGTNSLPNTIHVGNDIRHCNQLYFGPRSRAPSPSPYSNELRRRSDNALPAFIYATRWWPRESQLIGGWSGSGDDTFLNYAPAWMDPWTRSGANGRFARVGITRDAYGSPLGNCIVRLIRTSTDEMVCKVTSDANGLYYATSPYNDGHFIVVHGPGGTLAGATVDSLIPA